MNVYSRHYRTFRQYFNKNRKVYEFVIKFLNYELTEDFLNNQFKQILEPLELVEISEPEISYLHQNPVDFPLAPFGMMSKIEIKLWMSITAEELKMLIFEGLRIPFTNFVVYYKHDPFADNKEEYNELQQYLVNSYKPSNKNHEDTYNVPEMGYDFRNHDEKDNNKLYGPERFKELMKMMGKDTDIPNDQNTDKLFKFIDEDKNEDK